MKHLFVVALSVGLSVAVSAQEQAPKVFLDKSPAVVRFQLKRLSNEELLRVERKADDPKYKPVYEAILTRKGLAREFRIEAVDALARLNGSDPVTELLAAVGNVAAEDAGTLHDLTAMLLTQKPEVLKAGREKIAAATRVDNEMTRRAAYAALAVADGKPDAAWALAGENGSVASLLAALPLVPDAKVRAVFYPLVQPLADKSKDERTRVAAIEAISYTPGHEEKAFVLLADIVVSGTGESRAAAVRSIRRIPAAAWSKDPWLGLLAKSVVMHIEQTPPDKRTTPQAIEEMQLGYEVAAALPPDAAKPIRRALGDLGVRVVLVRTLREQMLYDLRYFVVEAGKPVQVVLENTDGMPHNLVVIAPGSLVEVGTAAATLPPPLVNDNKAYVPNSPKVLHATRMLNAGESDRLSFNAPATPGEYGYVCTFPGHFTRMYGVMLVVDSLDAWEQDPKPPIDPLLQKPIDSPKHQAGAAAAGHEHH